MVVCKFFQQGNCRYGQNCAYEHVYGSKYNYHANAPTTLKPQQSGVTDEQLINQVQTDVQAVLKGGQWILSSYAPFKEKPTFPGIADLSPEEARLFIYEAKSNNTLDQMISYMNNLVKENQRIYEQLLQPNPNVVKVLRSLYNGETPPPPFTTMQSAGSNPSSLFRSAVQNTSAFKIEAAPSIFSQNTNQTIFSQSNQNVFNQNQSSMFTQPQEAAAKSIFSQANQNIFGPQAPSQSVFNTQSPSNTFVSANQNIFGPKETQNTQIQSPSMNIFQTTNVSSVGSQNVFQQAVVEDSGVYSKMEDICEEDLEAFKSEQFVLGFVPEMPPPHSLCF